MFYERRVKSFSGLLEELARLDADAGVRVRGRYMGKPCYAFVTRFAHVYTVMVFGRQGGRPGGVGEKVLSKDYGSLGELGEFLRGLAAGRLEAYAY